MTPTDTQAWARSVRADLTDNVLPWWQRGCSTRKAVCSVAGAGWPPAGRPRTAVLGTRVLWSFSNAARQQQAAAGPARAAGAALGAQSLTDAEHGGLFWSVDAGPPHRRPQTDLRPGLWHLSLASCPETGGQAAAWRLFELIDTRPATPSWGYYEGCTRLAGAARRQAIGRRAPAPKTTNTLLRDGGLHRALPRPPDTRVRERLAS